MRRVALALTAVLASAALVGIGAGPSLASTPDASPINAAASTPYIVAPHPLPRHFSAPYVDITTVTGLAEVSKKSGSSFLSLAFLQTDAPGSCTLYWAGDTALPVSRDVFGADINRIRRAGGDVIPSFGGYSADTTNTEIADSCADVHRIARAYEDVVTTYKVQRLDFDIEADSLNSNPAGVGRRNEAIREVLNWAATTGRTLSIVYTLPSTPQGLGATGVALLQSAAAHHADIAGVNVMTFDYYDGLGHDMLADAKTAAAGLVEQMRATIAPHASTRQLWRKVGIIEMNGVDDYGPSETFTVDQAAPLVHWADQKDITMLSFWALQRDNGGCPGVKGSNDCSGVVQSDWAFSRSFARFTTAH